jgi:thermitase
VGFRRGLAYLAAFVIAVGLPVPAASGSALGAESGELIVRVEAGVSIDSLGVAEIMSLGGVDDSTFLVEVDPFRSLSNEIARLSAIDGVVYAEPNYVLTLATTPNDPDYSSLWGMQGGFGSNAHGAWAQGVTGSSEVYVAVVDSGIDVSHPDLAANVWVNSGETLNGADSDGNGFVDDIHGYDFLNDDGSVSDANEHPHGTHVAGTIGAVGNNGLGVAGVAWNVKLISAKFIGPDGKGSTANAIRALDYVTQLRTQKGLNIIATNNSYGGPQYSEAMNDAIRRGGDAGILFVAAAGNDSRDLEGRNDFPAVYNCHTELRDWDCVVTVGASGTTGALASFSNYGSTRVDLAAPGADILSTVTGGGYDLKSGTSMAAPHVTGALALCMAAFRGVSAREARDLLLSTVQPVAALAGKVASGGVLNASALVAGCGALSTSFAQAPSQMRARAIYTDRVRLEWADTTAGEFGHTLQVAVGPAGCTGSFSHLAFIGPGLNSYPVTGLVESEFYCFRVQATRAGAASSWATSNVAITWSTNAPFITGTVTLDDGVTPVRDARVSWRATATIGSVVEVFTDSAGRYVLQASAGTPGLLGLGNGNALSDVVSTPALPFGFLVTSALTVSEDTVIDIKAPALKQTTLRLVDRVTNQPIAGARLYTERNTIFRCKTNHGYRPFGSTAPTDCGFWPGSSWPNPRRTDANGELTLALPTSALYGDGSYRFTLVPDQARSSLVTFTVDTSVAAPSTIQLQTSELVTLSGKVLNSRGEASPAEVRWAPVGGASTVHWVTVNADAQGNYTTQVPRSTPVSLTMNGPQSCGGDCGNIKLPLRLTVGGQASFDSNSTVDIVGPATDMVTVRVVDQASGQPVPGAPVRPARTTIDYCDKDATYKPFAQATQAICSFYSVGNPANAVANASGEIRLHLPTATHYRRATYDISATRPGDAASAATISFAASSGNLKTIALPSAGVVISGKVQTSAGEPIRDAQVNFGVIGRPSAASILKTTSDAQGNYSLTVPAGELSELWVTTPNMHPSFEYAIGGYPSPGLPVGSNFGGQFTPTASSTVNLTMPEMATVTLTAVDAYSLAPVPNARFTTDRYIATQCNTRGYKAFESATTSICNFRILGPSNVPPIADSAGQVQIQLPLNSLLAVSDYVISAVHPFTNTRVGQQRFTVSSANPMNVQLVLPGTPSVPSQPTVTAGDSSVTLGWTEPWNGGAFIDFYRVWYALDAQGPYQRVTAGNCAGNIAPERRSCEATGLVPGVTYYFAIIAHNVVGASDMSVSVASVPTGPGGVLPPASNGSNGSAGSGGAGSGGAALDPAFAALSPVRQNPLRPGQTAARVLPDGTLAGIQVAPRADRRGLEFSAGGSQLSLAAEGVTVRDSGALAIQPGAAMQVAATGLKPGSRATVLLVPSAFYGLQVASDSVTTLSNNVLLVGDATVSTAGALSLTAQFDVAEGDYQLQILGTDSAGAALAISIETSVIGLLAEIEPISELEDEPMRAWVRRFDSSVKLYAKNIVGAGKVQFYVNGREVAWTRVRDAEDFDGRAPRVAGGSVYLVRSRDLVAGRNELRIKVDGQWVTFSNGRTNVVYNVR